MTEPPTTEGDPARWREALARAILEDRVDRGETLEGAQRKAELYARFLELMKQPHDVAACPIERQIRAWPGDLCFHTGQATVMVAAQGKGKTNALSWLIQKALRHRPTWDIYTNVPFPWDYELKGTVPSPPRLYPVGSLSELLRGIATTIRADRIPAVAIDEMDQAVTSHEWTSERSESWTKFLYVERHFRVRGPILAYHFYEHVPLPLRRFGGLRGSYFRLVVVDGERKLVRAEDTSQWWVVGESALPFQTLGHQGFDLDVNMGDLGAGLRAGSYKQAAQQVLDFLGQKALTMSAKDSESPPSNPLSAEALEASRTRELSRLVDILVADPTAKSKELRTRFHVGDRLLVKLRSKAAEIRATQARAPEDAPELQTSNAAGVP